MLWEESSQAKITVKILDEVHFSIDAGWNFCKSSVLKNTSIGILYCKGFKSRLQNRYFKGNAQFLFLCNLPKSDTLGVFITFPQIIQKTLNKDIFHWLEVLSEMFYKTVFLESFAKFAGIWRNTIVGVTF